MTEGATQITDIIEPRVFSAYVQQMTKEKSALFQSAAVESSDYLDSLLAGGGLTFDMPSFQDLDADDSTGADRTPTDDPSYSHEGVTAGSGTRTLDPEPDKIETSNEVAVRISRNNSWGVMDLAATLSGADPAAAIAGRVSTWWARRIQRMLIAKMQGIIADNTDNDSGDYSNDISGASYSAGVTDFSAEALLDAAQTMGDAQEDLQLIMTHSVVYNRMLKNDLIDFLPDSNGMPTIATYRGKALIVDDMMPRSGNVYDTWMFRGGAIKAGIAPAAQFATEIDRKAGAGNGGGETLLYSRMQFLLHCSGHAYTGTAPKGGPTNAATANNLAHTDSWNRVYPERKQIGFARLVTREA